MGMPQRQTLRTETLIRVRAPHFCAGLVIIQNYCVDAAPILSWAIGRWEDDLRAYFRRKRWIAQAIDRDQHIAG